MDVSFFAAFGGGTGLVKLVLEIVEQEADQLRGLTKEKGLPLDRPLPQALINS